MKTKSEWQCDMEFIFKKPYRTLIKSSKGIYTIAQYEDEYITLRQALWFAKKYKNVAIINIVPFVLYRKKEYAIWKRSKDGMLMWDNLYYNISTKRDVLNVQKLTINSNSKIRLKLNILAKHLEIDKSTLINNLIEMHYATCFRTNFIKVANE